MEKEFIENENNIVINNYVDEVAKKLSNNAIESYNTIHLEGNHDVYKKNDEIVTESEKINLVTKYNSVAGKILSDESRTPWTFVLDNNERIENTSDLSKIFGVISLPTLQEFDDLTSGLPFDSVTPVLKSDFKIFDDDYKPVEVKDGIYIETVGGNSMPDPNGRNIYIKQGSKHFQYHLSTFKGGGKKNIDCYMTDFEEEGIYIYISSKNEIRFIRKELIESNIRNYYGADLPDDVFKEIYDRYTAGTPSDLYVSYEYKGEILGLGSEIPSLENFDERKANELFKKGIKEYMKEHGIKHNEYSEEMEVISSFRR